MCYKNDNDNHNGNKIEIRLQNYQINFLLIVFEKKLDTKKKNGKEEATYIYDIAVLLASKKYSRLIYLSPFVLY